MLQSSPYEISRKANFENLIPHETEEDTMVNIYICINSRLTLVKLSR